jgi:hypothetical protein
VQVELLPPQTERFGHVAEKPVHPLWFRERLRRSQERWAEVYRRIRLKWICYEELGLLYDQRDFAHGVTEDGRPDIKKKERRAKP